jgi:hypothetical protein
MTPPNEIFHQNCLWLLIWLLHEHIPLLDTQTTPRKCSCWLSILQSNLTSLTKLVLQQYFLPQDQKSTLHKMTKAFVDDKTLWDPSYTASLREVATCITTKAQAWEQSVYVVSGALNLLKTFFYTISWNFALQEWPTNNENYSQRPRHWHTIETRQQPNQPPINQMHQAHQRQTHSWHPSMGMTRLNMSTDSKKPPSSSPIFFMPHWIERAPGPASQQWFSRSSSIH